MAKLPLSLKVLARPASRSNRLGTLRMGVFYVRRNGKTAGIFVRLTGEGSEWKPPQENYRLH